MDSTDTNTNTNINENINENIILTNDSQSHTYISLNIDNPQINHEQLNKFIAELHDLGLKYNLVNIKDGA